MGPTWLSGRALLLNSGITIGMSFLLLPLVTHEVFSKESCGGSSGQSWWTEEQEDVSD